jgi:hypothetical protein
VEEGPQEVIGGQGDVEMGHVQQVAGDVVDPVIHPDRSAERSRRSLAAAGAEAGFAGEGEKKLALTARANIASVATVRVATEQQALDDLANVSALVGRNFLFQAPVAPAVPMIEEDLTESVVAGGMVGATPRG